MVFDTVLKIVISAIDNFGAVFKKFDNSINNSEKKFKELSKSGMAFLGIGLNMLFMGMALERFFGGALRSIFDTYVKIVDVSDVFFQKTQHLRAGWEFLKYSLIDALSQNELFLNLIDFLIQAVNWVGAFLNRHPDLSLFILGFFALTYAIGTVLVPLGMLVLLMSSLGIAALPVFLITILVITLLSLVFVTLFGNLSKVDKFLALFLMFIIALIIIFAVFGIAVSLPFLAIIVLLGMLFLLLAVFWDDFVAGAQKIWLVMKIVGLGIKLIFFEMINAIIQKFAQMFNYIVDFLPDKVKKAFGIEPINAVQFDTGEIRNRIAELKAEGASIETARESARSETQKLSIKDGIKEGLKDMMPDFSDAIKTGITDSRSDIYPSTYE